MWSRPQLYIIYWNIIYFIVLALSCKLLCLGLLICETGQVTVDKYLAFPSCLFFYLGLILQIDLCFLALKSFSTHIAITVNQFSSVAQSCATLCDPKNLSTPGLPVHHQLPEFTQTHIHRVSDAIQPSHPLSSLSPPAPNPSQHQSLLQWVNSLHEVAKVLEFQL